MSVTKIKELAIEIFKEIKSLEKFEGESTYTFVRTSYYTHGYSTWKILLDRSKTRLSTRDSQGFKIVNSTEHNQFVTAPQGTRDLLLAKNKEDREVAKTILDTLAEEKYG